MLLLKTHGLEVKADLFCRTIATYQTLNNEQRLMKFDTKMFKAVIIDEAHHAAAPSSVYIPIGSKKKITRSHLTSIGIAVYCPDSTMT